MVWAAGKGIGDCSARLDRTLSALSGAESGTEHMIWGEHDQCLILRGFASIVVTHTILPWAIQIPASRLERRLKTSPMIGNARSAGWKSAILSGWSFD